MSVVGHNRKSRTTILMSVKPPKAEVSRSRSDVRYVPLTEVAMLVEEPSTASKVVIAHLTGDLLITAQFQS
jgi:hypothetical protein